MGKFIGRAVITVLSALVLFGIYWWLLPPLSIFYLSGFAFIMACVLVAIGNVGLWLSAFATDTDAVIGNTGKVAIAVAAVALIASIVLCFANSPIFKSEHLSKQIGEVAQYEFADLITQVDDSQIPTVDKKLAKKQGEKLLGEDAGLGSRVDVGDFTMQSIDGKLVYVAPLEHEGFFKWSENGSTPGFIQVSATNSADVKYITTDASGNAINNKYQPSAYFGDDLKRHLVMDCGFNTVGLGEFNYEIADDNKPYYIVTTFENTLWWGAPEATGVIVCDPATGDAEWYSVNDAPEWIDRIQPGDYIQTQLANYGTLSNGWWNSIFAKTDVISPSDGYGYFYIDDDCWFYTGMTSVGSDNSTVGFYINNTRTKETRYFSIAGATESAARSSAEGVVQAYGYEANYPIPLNINGTPTYFMALKDNEGLVKSYAMVNIENYSVVATGSNIADTKRAYMQSLANAGGGSWGDTTTELSTVAGKIARISSNIENGNTYYYFLIGDDMETIYTASYALSNELALTRDGDTVTVTFIPSNAKTITASTFDNEGIAGVHEIDASDVTKMSAAVATDD